MPRKVFNRILLIRMKTEVDRHLRDEKAGFRQDRSCTDHITTLHIIIEHSLKWNSPLYVGFIDMKKAFDSVDRTTLWKLLEHHDIPEKIISMVQAVYEPFNIVTGIRQGCMLSPFLFPIALDWIMTRTTEGHKRGVQWSLFKQRMMLLFCHTTTCTATLRKK